MPPDIAMPILGRTVFGPTGDTVGRIVDVLVDGAGLPQAMVLDVGGFLGVGDRTIAVHWAALRFHPSDKDHPITVNMPADEIAAAPQYVDTTAPAQVVVPHATPAAAPPKPPASASAAKPPSGTPAPVVTAPAATPAPATPPQPAPSGIPGAGK